MVTLFGFYWLAILCDTAPYVVLWLLLEVWLHSRQPLYVTLLPAQRWWVGVRYAFGRLWDKSWYWQLLGVSVLAGLTLVLPTHIKDMAGLAFTSDWQSAWYEIASVAFLGMLTLARGLKRLFPYDGGGCGNGQCSIDGR